MAAIDSDEPLQRLIYHLIRNYVDKRTRDRARVGDEKKYAALDEHEQKKYRDIKPKVAADAFLALRARRERDIAEYFTGSLCAFGNHLPENDFLLLADALLRDPDKVKSLAMLALSAHSWTARAKDEASATETSENPSS